MKTVTVRLWFSTIATAACVTNNVVGFTVPATTTTLGSVHQQRLGLLRSQSEKSEEADVVTKKESQTLGLITFDLDDTLYPIDKVVAEANGKKKKTAEHRLKKITAA